jgi:purine nucleosidase
MKSKFPMFDFKVPEQKQIRLIINTDAKNEADDQYAIVHVLLTQKFCIKGIIAAHFGDQRTKDSMNESYSEVKRLIEFMGIEENIPVLHGAPHAMKNEETPIRSEGCDVIIKEALRNDPRPLFCIFLGPLTDMASALKMCPGITNKLTVVWIGGGAWPEGGWEFNLQNDIIAANVVYKSNIDLWQIPRNVYSMIKVSLSELQVRVKPYGSIGNYLFTQMVEFNDQLANNPGWPLGESWVLGDSAAIGVLLDPHDFCFSVYDAPRIDENMNYIHDMNNRKIRHYNSIDARFILEDFYSKLQLCFPG